MSCRCGGEGKAGAVIMSLGEGEGGGGGDGGQTRNKGGERGMVLSWRHANFKKEVVPVCPWEGGEF